mmetsp:Transcript_111632/g.316066  ORF Transcript_111632/g.316066 Transcript_111632/m.316066 type:complete len:474 (-) Transcript_111632:113-1534(-)
MLERAARGGGGGRPGGLGAPRAALPQLHHRPRRDDEQLLRPLRVERAVRVQRGLAQPLRAALHRPRGHHHRRAPRRPPQREGPHGAVGDAAEHVHLHGVQGPRVLQLLHPAGPRRGGALAGAGRAHRGAAPPPRRALRGAGEHEVHGDRLRAPAEVRGGDDGAERPRGDRPGAGEPPLHGGRARRRRRVRAGGRRPRPSRHGHGHRDLPADAEQRPRLLRQGRRRAVPGPEAPAARVGGPEHHLRRHLQRRRDDRRRAPAHVRGPHGRGLGVAAPGGGERARRAAAGGPGGQRRVRRAPGRAHAGEERAEGEGGGRPQGRGGAGRAGGEGGGVEARGALRHLARAAQADAGARGQGPEVVPAGRRALRDRALARRPHRRPHAVRQLRGQRHGHRPVADGEVRVRCMLTGAASGPRVLLTPMFDPGGWNFARPSPAGVRLDSSTYHAAFIRSTRPSPEQAWCAAGHGACMSICH